MKKILVVSACTMRGNTTGLTGKFLNSIKDLDKSAFEVSLYDIGFFEEKHASQKYPVKDYFKLPEKGMESLIRKIPKVRSLYAELIIISTFKKIIKSHSYNAVLFHNIPTYVNVLVGIAHANNTKVIFYPWGSDVMNVDLRTQKRLMKAFATVDYVVGSVGSNVVRKAKELYNVPAEKLRLKQMYLSGVQTLMEVRKNLTKEEMSNMVGISYSNYNIICSYNGYISHRHRIIIEAVAKNKSVLPKNYQLVFPMTYGAKDEYVEELRLLCESSGLNAVFITSFLTNEQMAYLHMITDLFIEIQPTDAGNAFMIEALFARNQIITGSWLNYYHFEQFGIPYHLIDSVEDLPNMINKVLTNQIEKPIVPRQLIEMYVMPEGYKKSTFWAELFTTI